MQFLYPWFLLSLLLIAIPVIIHLFHFRRFKRVYFTNVRFLKEVKEETASRSRLRNLLVLLMRILAIAFLVFAFAQPFIPVGEKVERGIQHVSVYIDNSFSMSAMSRDVPLLELARRRGKEIVGAYSEEDRFQILSNRFSGRQQRLFSKGEALSLLDEITIGPEVRTMSQVLNRQRQVITEPNVETTAYLVSDFQENTTDLEAFHDTSFSVNLVPLQSVQEKNVSIDSCWFISPVQMLNQTNPLIIRLRNHSDESVENVRLSLQHEGQEKPVGSIEIPPRSYSTDTVNVSILRTGWHKMIVKITDYPVQFDDTYFLSFYVDENVRVQAIHDNEPNRFLNAAFRGIEHFSITNTRSSNIDYSSLPEYDLIVLHDTRSISSGLASELLDYVENGGNLMIFPPNGADLPNYNDFLRSLGANTLDPFNERQREVTSINTDEFIFDNVFENRRAALRLPVTEGNFPIGRSRDRGEERLMQYRDGYTFLAKYRHGDGRAYLSSAPLSDTWNDLARNAEIFIPMLYKMALSGGQSRPLAYTIGESELIPVESYPGEGDMVYKIRGEGQEFIPQQRNLGKQVLLDLGTTIQEAGFYDVYLDEQDPSLELAFNYNRKESLMRFVGNEELNELADRQGFDLLDGVAEADFGELIKQKNEGIRLWKYCLLLALLFLLLESLLLRFWKV